MRDLFPGVLGLDVIEPVLDRRRERGGQRARHLAGFLLSYLGRLLRRLGLLLQHLQRVLRFQRLDLVVDFRDLRGLLSGDLLSCS